MENKLNKKVVLESIEQELGRIKEESSCLEKELKAKSGIAVFSDFGAGFAISALCLPDYINDNFGIPSYIGIAIAGTIFSAIGIWATYNTWKDLHEIKHLGKENMEQIKRDVDKLRKYN